MERESDCLDSSGMFHWCKATPLDKVILVGDLVPNLRKALQTSSFVSPHRAIPFGISQSMKRTEKSKHEFRNHIVACVFGDAHSTLMGLRNFVMPLRASNYTRQELKDIVFVGSLDYLQREWRFLQNFPQIYILPGSALYSGDLHAVNIEECSMCAVLSSPSKSSSSPTLVDMEPIMATLNIGSLRISCSAQTPSEPQCTRCFGDNPGKSKYRRIPILTELKNPSNMHFIEQLGGMEGDVSGMSLHLSTSFATGTVFSGSFLDSLLATAFYNYHVLELLQMLVTGGISSQLEQHLDKEKFCGLNDSYSTVSPGRMRCKLGLLSLNQTILSDIQPRRTFGQIFCGSLDNLGVLCLGLYRMIDEEERNPEHKRGVCWCRKCWPPPKHRGQSDFILCERDGQSLGPPDATKGAGEVDNSVGSVFVITRPENEFMLLPSDLVFCAIPFSTSCYKKDISPPSPCEIINMVPLTEETLTDINCPPSVDQVSETATQPPSISVCSLEPKPIPVGDPKQAVLTPSGKLSSQTHPGETTKEDGKENMEETTVEDASAYPESD
eukprot:bmy_13144T0